MPRKAKDQERALFEMQVIRAFQKTTVQERFDIALNWCLGHRDAHVSFATMRGIVPIALVVAALVDVEHPLLVDERGSLRAGSLLGSTVMVLDVVINERVVHIPCVQTEKDCVQAGVVHKGLENLVVKWELPVTGA